MTDSYNWLPGAVRDDNIMYEGRFYVRREVNLMKTAKLNAYIMCICSERFSFYLYMQPKIISKCITLMTSKGQRHTYISDTGNMVEIWPL